MSQYERNKRLIQQKREELAKSNIAMQRFEEQKGKLLASGRPPPSANAPVELTSSQSAQLKSKVFLSHGLEEQAKQQTPEGYVFGGIHQEKVPIQGPLRPGETQKYATRYIATYYPEVKEVWASKSLFGPQVTRPASEAEKQALYKRMIAGEDVSQSAEQRALTGLGIATTTAVGVTVPIAGATGLGFVVGGEGVKRAITGKDLTVEEAVALAGVGELSAVTALSVRQSLQPRFQAKIDASFQKAVENQQLYKPSLTEKLYMRSFGAKVPRLAQEVVGAGESPPVSFKMLQKGKLGAEEEAYFWGSPTPRSSEVYVAKVGGSRAKTWAGEQLIKRVSGGLSYSLIQREIQKPLSRELPYIPKEPALTEAVDVSAQGAKAASLLGITLASAIQKPKILQRALQRGELQKRSELSQRLVQSQELSQVQQQAQRQKTALVQTQSLAQILKTQQKPFTPSPLTPRTDMSRINNALARFGGGSGGEGSKYRKSYRWFFRKHPIATPAQNLAFQLGITTKRAPRHKRKRSKGR